MEGSKLSDGKSWVRGEGRVKDRVREISNYRYDGIKNSEGQVLASKDGY